MKAWVLAAVGLVGAGCSRSTPTQSSVAPTVSLAPVQAASAPRSSPVASATSPAADAAVAPVSARTDYPVGTDCSKAGALADEHKTLPPRAAWLTLVSKAQRVRLRVPPGVFRSTERRDGWHLVSALNDPGYGEDGKGRFFAIRVLRVRRSVDALLADTSKTSPLADMFLEGAFPARTSGSFVVDPQDPVGSGGSERVTVAGRPAYLWVMGIEGDNTDHVLVDLGVDDALLVVADWNAGVTSQPECYQRQILGGVMDSVEVVAE